MNADPVVMEFFPKSLDKRESDSFADRIERGLEARAYGLWAVEVIAGAEFIGFIGFNYTEFPSDFTPCVEIGWRLARKAWGMGYATEGARRCLAYGFGELQFDRVFSFTASRNTRSERVMQKLGMKKEKEFFHPKVDPSSPLCRHVLYSITGTEYGQGRVFPREARGPES